MVLDKCHESNGESELFWLGESEKPTRGSDVCTKARRTKSYPSLDLEQECEGALIVQRPEVPECK